MECFPLTFLFGILLLFFHNIFENSLFARGLGTVCRSCFFTIFSVHNRTLLWNFKDLKCLIGSDLPIFGDEDHPCVSLKLVNVKKPINILTGLDYWLDNLMCQVPEVLMCFHDEGIVKK